jgi:hypothetical protein
VFAVVSLIAGLSLAASLTPARTRSCDLITTLPWCASQFGTDGRYILETCVSGGAGSPAPPNVAPGNLKLT